MIYLIALSSNVASPRLDPKDIISQALWLFSGEGLHQRTVSDVFLAPMLPEGEGPDYLTSVAVIETEWPLGDLALRLRKIEAALGDHGPNSGGARVLRLETIGPWPATSRDLMALRGAGQAALLPNLAGRADILVPLAEVAPDWQHPELNRSAAELLAACSHVDRGRIVPYIATDSACDVAE